MATEQENKQKEMDEVAKLAYETMNFFENCMQEYTDNGRIIAKRTTRINRGAIGLFILVSICILFMLYRFTEHMVVLVDSMESMYTHFGVVSQNMHVMTGSVVNMNENVRGMPVMATEMEAMNLVMSQMQQDMAKMQQDIVVMDRSVENISLGVHDMANRFVHLNDSVQHMEYNVKHLSNPMRKLFP